MEDLGTLGGALVSTGYAINTAGQVAGESGNSPDTSHAFRYAGTPGSGGVMADLGTLGGKKSQGFGINTAGQVVGLSDYLASSTATHAFLYTGTPGAGGRMTDLDAWLDTNSPTEGAKWTLLAAKGINDTGWITGSGTYDPDGVGPIAAQTNAFLLNAGSLVPEPGSLSLLAVGSLTLLRRRRR